MIIKLILIGICVCFLSLFLKSHQQAFVLILNIGFVVLVILTVSDKANDIVKGFADLLSVSSSADKMFISLYKGAAICMLTKVSSDICKESGNVIVSDMIDLGGRVMLLIISFPFIESIIKTATAFVT